MASAALRTGFDKIMLQRHSKMFFDLYMVHLHMDMHSGERGPVSPLEWRTHRWSLMVCISRIGWQEERRRHPFPGGSASPLDPSCGARNSPAPICKLNLASGKHAEQPHNKQEAAQSQDAPPPSSGGSGAAHHDAHLRPWPEILTPAAAPHFR